MIPDSDLPRTADLANRLQLALGAAYTVERELGGGGMSRVFVAIETALGRRVAVKVLPPELAAGLNVDRFRREIQLAASLQHPHIVPLLSAGSAGDLLFYTMPMVDGESLRSRLERQGALPIGETVRILRDVVDALSCAHEREIIHRDIKPDNVLLSRHHALVADFGVAKALTEATATTFATTGGMALGTPAYMAPEQASADPNLDDRCDIYAVGVLAYEMLTGRPPFGGASPQAILVAQVTRAPEPVDRNREVPPDLAALVMRCLEKDPAARWQTTDELLQQLERVAAESLHPRASGHPLRATAIFLALSGLILVGTRALIVALGLPDWVFTLAAVLLAAGLPIIFATALVNWQGGTHRLFTWPKAVTGGVVAFAGLGVLTGGYMFMRAFGIGPMGSLVASGVLKDRERIIVADFENRTGDSLMGEALTQAFQVDFAQSAAVTPVPAEVIREALGRMGKPDTSSLTFPLAREVAIREGVKAVVVGDIRPAGRQFVLTAKLVAAGDGGLLAAHRETARDSSQVVRAVDRLSKKLRERIGESLRTIRASPPLDQVTTRSLTALRKYSQGLRAVDQGDVARGVALLEEAIGLDSGFAMAHRKVGVVLGNTGQRRDREVEALTKAFEYRHRLPDRERYLAAGTYYASVTGERNKAIEAYRSLLDEFPRDPIALNNLALEYEWNRDYRSATPLFERAIGIDSSNPVYYGNLAANLVACGLTDSAAAILAVMERKFSESPGFALFSSFFPSGSGNYDSAAARLQALTLSRVADPSWRILAGWQLANIAAVRGQLAETDRRLEDAMRMEEEGGDRGSYLERAARRAWLAAWAAEEQRAALRNLETALRRHPLDRLSPPQRPYSELARSYAVAGRPATARALLGEYERLIPPLLRRSDEQKRRAAHGFIALAEARFIDAIAEFRAADEGDCRICTLAPLGRAYDLAGQPDSAIAIYERYLTTPWYYRINVDGAFLPGIYFRLGELYENRGERDKAINYYHRFTSLWKSADPPSRTRVAEARRRIQTLTTEPSARP